MRTRQTERQTQQKRKLRTAVRVVLRTNCVNFWMLDRCCSASTVISAYRTHICDVLTFSVVTGCYREGAWSENTKPSRLLCRPVSAKLIALGNRLPADCDTRRTVSVQSRRRLSSVEHSYLGYSIAVLPPTICRRSDLADKAVVTTTIRFRFDCNSTALRPLDDLRYVTCCGLM